MSKLLTLTLLLIVVYVILKIPTVGKILSCYDRNVQSFDDAEYGTRAQGWSGLKLCQMKQQAVFELEQCITDIGQADMVPGNVYNVIIKVLPIVRPGVKDIPDAKADHDAECADYQSTQFGSP
jgi:hypothetical protein